MSIFQIFDIAASGMSAQNVRLNTVASNLANIDTVSSSPDNAYRARMPMFSSVLNGQGSNGMAVRVDRVLESQAMVPRHYAPDHPLADQEGYVYRSNVNIVEEMANMTSASQSYQTNIEVMSTIKRLALSTLRLGQS